MTKMIKRFNVAVLAGLVAASTALTTPVVMAEPGADTQNHRGGPRGGGPKGGKKGNRAEKAFARLDANEDSVLSLEEMTANVDAKAEKLLGKKDADEDGLLSLEEFSTNRRGEVRDLSDIADEIVQCVTDLKAESGDDNIVVPSADDFQSPEARFNALDTSADGALDLDELQAGGMAKATARFNGMDADDSSDVSLEEFLAASASHRATKKAVRQCVQEINDDSEV